jgi:hypothetical protein
MALPRQSSFDDWDPREQLHPYLRLITYEYALRREAGLEAKEAVRWSLRRVLPPPDGLHPALAMIAGYKVESDIWDAQAASLLHALIVDGDRNWHNLQQSDGWLPGTVGMGW